MAMRVAALADVHGNAPALEAVLGEVAGEGVDLVVFCGDLTWGPLPNETLAIVRALDVPTRFVRGNADRMVGTADSVRSTWMAEQHDAEATRLVNGFEQAVVVDVDGLGPTRFVHGSPRSDEECVTERTPPERVAEFMAGVPERVVVTAHIHVSYDRRVGDVRLLSPGSVGRPYEGERGARWALLGPDVELRRTDYDHERTAALYRASGIPDVEDDVQALLEPMSRDEMVEHAERVVFAG
jgi:predicted phosphodiesterase